MSTVYSNAIGIGLLSAFTVLLDIPPLIWHAKHRNLAASTLIGWIILTTLFNVINAMIWPNDNILERFDGRGYCDIQVKIVVGSWAALPCTFASILRSLGRVLDPNNITLAPTKAQKRREMGINLLFLWVGPAYMIATHYIFQPNRYEIDTIAGCTPTVVSNWVSAVFFMVVPLVFMVVDAYYAIILIIRLRRYRNDVAKMLTAHNTNKSRFYRLLAMSLILLLALLPLQAVVFYFNLTSPGWTPSYAWTETHEYFDQIYVQKTGDYVIFDRWIRPAAGLLVFVFFGIGRDAMDMYKGWARKLGLSKFFPRLLSTDQKPKHQRNKSGFPFISQSSWFKLITTRVRGAVESSKSSLSTFNEKKGILWTRSSVLSTAVSSRDSKSEPSNRGTISATRSVGTQANLPPPIARGMMQNPLRSHPSFGPNSLQFQYDNNNRSAAVQSLAFEREDDGGTNFEDPEDGNSRAIEERRDAGTSMDLEDGTEADWVKQELRGL
ncbi:MAG: a-factor receptor [Alyxoria varia]|nr:MAG: a-factor receptor [Alyxoria varia]